MFIYILNLLNDGVKSKNDINERSASEIINDTNYITRLAGIKKDLNFKEISNKIIDIFQLLNKYNFTLRDKIGILNKLMINKQNNWILNNLISSNNLNENETDLIIILNNIAESNKIENDKKIKPVSLLTSNVEQMKEYYLKFFDCKVGKTHFSKNKGFDSYFICFKSGIKLKIISEKETNYKKIKKEQALISISVGSKEKVSSLIESIKKAGFEIVRGTRFNCNEYYENCVLDPEGNLIQITI